MLAGLWPFAIWAHCFEENFHAPSVFFLLPWLNLYTLQHHHHLVGLPTMTSSCVDIVASLCVLDRQKGKKKYYRCLNYSIASWSEWNQSRHWLLLVGDERAVIDGAAFFSIRISATTPKSQRSKLVRLKRRSSVFERLCVHLSSQTQSGHTFNLSSKTRSSVG